MKRVVVGLVTGLFFLLPVLGFSETVMLYTKMQLHDDAVDKNVERFVAVEDGVMALFFDSGDIIFDTGLPSKVSAAQADSFGSRWAVETARSGGASYLLELELAFPNEPYPALVPAKVHYRLSDVSSGQTITEGEVVPDLSAADAASKKPYDLCYSVGQEVARDVLAHSRTL